MILTLDVALLLGLAIFLRTKREHVIRTRADGYLTIALVAAFGILVAPTPAGQAVAGILGQIVRSLNGLDL